MGVDVPEELECLGQVTAFELQEPRLLPENAGLSSRSSLSDIDGSEECKVAQHGLVPCALGKKPVLLQALASQLLKPSAAQP